MKNKTDSEYKKYFDKISPDKNIVEDTKKKMIEELNSTVYQERKNIFVYRRIAAAAACSLIVGSAVIMVPKLKNAPTASPSPVAVSCETSQAKTSESAVTDLSKENKASVSEKSKSVSLKEPAVTEVTSASMAKKNNPPSGNVNNNNFNPASGTNNRETAASQEKQVTAIPVSTEKHNVTEASSENNTPQIVSSENKKDDIPSIIGQGGDNIITEKPVSSVSEAVSTDTSAPVFIYTDDGNEYEVNKLYNTSWGAFNGDEADSGSVNSHTFLKKKHEDILSEINEIAVSRDFDPKLVVPEYFLENNSINSLFYNSSSFLYSFGSAHSALDEGKMISLGITRKDSDVYVGYNMSFSKKPLTNLINGVDVTIGLSYSQNDVYCVSFEKDGLVYNIMFKEYSQNEIINYIMTLL